MRELFTGELGYRHYEYYCLLTREVNDIVEGYNRKMQREENKFILQLRMMRKAAFVSILPHTKNLSEKRFNTEMWPIDEKLPGNKNYAKDRIENIQEQVRQYNLKNSEKRRKKALANGPGST